MNAHFTDLNLLILNFLSLHVDKINHTMVQTTNKRILQNCKI